MKIPAGKSVKITAMNLGEKLLTADRSETEGLKTSQQSYVEISGDYIELPPKGYKGSMYLSDDLNLNFTANFSNPMAELLNSVPDIANVALTAKTGQSLKANKLASLKYWTNTEPLSLDLRIMFETQMDPFYDVYLPVMKLLMLIVPGQGDFGYISPTPSLKFLFGTVSSEIKTLLEKTGANVQAKVLGHDFNLKDMITGGLDDLNKNIVSTGHTVSIELANFIKLNNVLVKAVNVNFSTEICYCPVFFVNGNAYREQSTGTKSAPRVVWSFFNPYTKGEQVVQTLTENILGPLAIANSGLSSVGALAGSFVPSVGDAIAKFPPLKKLPLKCEVSLSIETQFPVSKQELTKIMTLR